MIKEFKGKYFFLSNFYIHPIEYQELTFQSSEAAFQAQKSMDEKVVESFCNLFPGQAKYKGRQIELRPDWEEIKDWIMKDILYCKFTQDEGLKKMLLNTGEEVLVEGNYWHDNYYGDCLCAKCKSIVGKNILGILLMEVRKELE